MISLLSITGPNRKNIKKMVRKHGDTLSKVVRTRISERTTQAALSGQAVVKTRFYRAPVPMRVTHLQTCDGKKDFYTWVGVHQKQAPAYA